LSKYGCSVVARNGGGEKRRYREGREREVVCFGWFWYMLTIVSIPHFSRHTYGKIPFDGGLGGVGSGSLYRRRSQLRGRGRSLKGSNPSALMCL